jgi:hypothetical protein
VHRDVKPDNLMLTSDGQVKLADLGLARHLEKGKTAQEEGIFGTPHFISPEQAQGQEVDHRADLYSLGATAYRLLAGKTPFTGANVSEIIHKQINEDPEPLEKLAPDCPPELTDLIRRLMKKKPDERPASAQALLAELERIRLQYHMKAAGVGKGGKGLFIAVAIALLAVAAVVVIALTKKEPPPPTYITQGSGAPAVGTQEPTIIIKDDPEQNAKVAYLDLKVAEAGIGDLEKAWKTHQDEWLALAVRYEQVATDLPGTEYGATAGERAAEIKEYIRSREKAEADALKQAGTAWNSLKAKVTNSLEEGRYGDALASLDTALQDQKLARALKVLSEAHEQVETWNSEAAGSIRARFSSAFTATRDSVEQFRKQEKFAEAVQALRDFVSKACGTATGEPFDRAVAEARELADELREDYRAILEAQIEADRQLYYSTYRAVRHQADAPELPESNLIFNFRFEAAAQQFEAILAAGGGSDGLVTEPYRERARNKAKTLRSIQALIDALVARINSAELDQDRLDFPKELAGGADTKITFNRGKEPVATREGIELAKKIKVKGTTATVAEFLQFSELTPLQFWELIFLSGQRFAMTPEQQGAAAALLAECGVELGLEECMTAAGNALAPAERARLSAELAAIRAWNAVLAARTGAPPENWNIDANRFVDEQSETDFFILVYGFDGAGRKPLLPESTLNSFYSERLNPLEWR